MLVDSHHHVWDLTRSGQSWLDAPEHAPIRRSFAIDDLRAAATRPIAGRRLGATVVVQSIVSDQETRDLLAMAGNDDLVAAVVGWVDLLSPGVGDQLDSLIAAPGGAYLRAVRHLVQGERDPDWLQLAAVERGLCAVAQRGLGYDILIRSHQLPQAQRLAARNPDLPLVLDHAGKPPIVTGQLGFWERHLTHLARYENVTCKVSGLITEANLAGWSVKDIRPVWEVLLNAFGPERLMFGSDWPVCTLAGSWNRWAETVEELLDDLTHAGIQAVTCATATKFYGLSAPDAAALI